MVQLREMDESLDSNGHKDSKLKGTFVAVMILGGFILACWLFVFILFVIRNGG